MPSETAPRTAHDLLDAILAPTGEVAPGVLRPAVREHTREAYDALYREYTELHDYFGRGTNDVMHRLKALRRSAHSRQEVPV